ncbi:adult-specific rigid cuticular protein 15.7-like [Uloborus diversus]|uniref:adult-specific rigid cuticular protein 15.7-like n=1 Tax=Uloborus diversus TaxID=327109 RepID=UPI002409D016|nr:adult-specific rigid cuticular protein 15.7-like [Uloborus diversus]
MFRKLLLAVAITAVCGTPYIYKPAIYSRPASVYVQPAVVPISYSAPVVVKEAPKPYSFGYEAPAIGGSSSRQESSDGNGRVTGSYTVTDADGRVRVVDYYADETGFHANVKTNEPGTANQDPADVSVQSYAAPEPIPVAVAPKVVAPVYSVPVARRVVSPASLTYSAVPTYYRPITYSQDLYSGYHSPYYTSYPVRYY